MLERECKLQSGCWGGNLPCHTDPHPYLAKYKTSIFVSNTSLWWSSLFIGRWGRNIPCHTDPYPHLYQRSDHSSPSSSSSSMLLHSSSSSTESSSCCCKKLKLQRRWWRGRHHHHCPRKKWRGHHLFQAHLHFCHLRPQKSISPTSSRAKISDFPKILRKKNVNCKVERKAQNRNTFRLNTSFFRHLFSPIGHSCNSYILNIMLAWR